MPDCIFGEESCAQSCVETRCVRIHILATDSSQIAGITTIREHKGHGRLFICEKRFGGAGVTKEPGSARRQTTGHRSEDWMLRHLRLADHLLGSEKEDARARDSR